MNQPVWTPSPERVAASNLRAFMRRLSPALDGYDALYRYSVAHPADFWSALWDFCGVIGDRPAGGAVLEHAGGMADARWFPGARLNLAENLLRRRDAADALVALDETGAVRRVSFGLLHDTVSRLVQALRAAGVRPGDRVAGLLPNVPETVAAMLATTALGAVWCVCSPDYGVDAVVDRLAQVQPRLLFAGDRYRYQGKAHDLASKVAEVVARLPSVGRTVVVSCLAQPDAAPVATLPGAIGWDDFLAPHAAQSIAFERFPFDHPACILFSSGTTGAPKCIVHRTGGPLLQNLKDMALQFDVKRDDRIYWWTSTGWVAWNMLLFGLGCEATVLLYDGSPLHPAPGVLFDHAQAERVTFLRLTPKVVEAVAKHGLQPMRTHDLSALKCITVGGSPFSAEGMRYLYENVKADVQVASPAGGTDPLGAFAAGNPISPVWAGEIQCRGLGLQIEIFDEQARPVVGARGELVCTRPFPSMPLGFWGDDGGRRFHATYFSTYPGVWRHGDWAELTPRGGVVIHGRSDSTLKVRGVRIGTAEIYRQVERVAEVADSVVVDRDTPGGGEVVLFVQLKPGVALDAELHERIRLQIRHGASPRYVPDRIVRVDDIPRTGTGKVSEPAVRAALHGQVVANRNALLNPEALRMFDPAQFAGG